MNLRHCCIYLRSIVAQLQSVEIESLNTVAQTLNRRYWVLFETDIVLFVSKTLANKILKRCF